MPTVCLLPLDSTSVLRALFVRRVQTSADVFNTSLFRLRASAGPGGAGGACTNAMLSVLTSNKGHQQPSWIQLLEGMRGILAKHKFEQARCPP